MTFKKGNRNITIKSGKEVGHKPDFTVIRASELNRIKEVSNRTALHDPSTSLTAPECSELDRNERGRTRREKILQLEKERKERNKFADGDTTQSECNELLIAKSLQALDEEMEEAKRLNQLISLAKVQTIRELQIEEKKRIMGEIKQADKRADALMERERQKAAAKAEEDEEKRIASLREGSAVIVKQLHERTIRRQLEEEACEKERLWMEQLVEQDRLGQERVLAEKRECQRKTLEEVLAANEAAMKRKEERLAAEREDNEKVLQYQKLRDDELRKREETAAAEAALKEKELCRLRAMQERAQNKAVELDILRARRAVEAAERAAREKEKQEREGQKRITESLSEARRIQQAGKQYNLIEQARLDKKEYDRLVEAQEQLTRIEKQKEEENKIRQTQHADELRRQIELKRELKEQQRFDSLMEGNLMNATLNARKNRIQQVRKQKLDLLIKSGVPEKHCSNIRKTLSAI